MELSGYSPATQKTYGYILRNFDGDFSREGALRFLDNLHYKPSSYRMAYQALKTLFKVNNLPWPLQDIPAPLVDEDDYQRVIFPPEEVGKLIAFAKIRGTPAEKFILALATIYGLRRAEVANLSIPYLEDNIIMIKTAKRGFIRKHLVPREIYPYIQILPWQKISPISLHFLFERLRLKAGITKVERMGLHSIRRSLITGLLDNGLDHLLLFKFMGWRSNLDRSSSIIRIYDRRTPREIDRQVFAVHPFLTLWR